MGQAAAQVHEGWISVARLSELRESQPRPADILGHPVVLVRLGGAVHAVDGYCPHRGMLLTDGKLSGTALRCLWHGFQYDVRSGEMVWPEPCAEQVPVYATRVRRGLVQVRVRLAE